MGMKGVVSSFWCSALGGAAASVQVREGRVLVQSFPGHPDKVQMCWKAAGLGGCWFTPGSQPYLCCVCVLTGLATMNSSAWKCMWERGWHHWSSQRRSCNSLVALAPASAPASLNKAVLKRTFCPLFHISVLLLPFPTKSLHCLSCPWP